jgi:rsbT co-antagonist protein RsbR
VEHTHTDLPDLFKVSEADCDLIKRLGEEAKPHIKTFINDFYVWLPETISDFTHFFGTEALLKRVKESQTTYWQDFFSGVIDEQYMQSRYSIGKIHSVINLPLDKYTAAMYFSLQWWQNKIPTLNIPKTKLLATANALNNLIFFDTSLISMVYHQQQQRITMQQKQTLLELSAPILRLWKNILVLPLVGAIDAERAKQIVEKMLNDIVANEAKIVIVDLTGVPVIDTYVGQHIIKTIHAVNMLGAEVVLTGISPEIANTLTKLNLSFDRAIIKGSLESGFIQGLDTLGQKVISTNSSH